MNINELQYQKDLIEAFEKNGWILLDKNKNVSEEHLKSYNKNILKSFLLKKYTHLLEDENELNEIFNFIENSTSSLDWEENNKNGINEILKEGISTNYTKNNGLRSYSLIDFDNFENNILNIQEEVWISFDSRVDLVQYINGLPVYIWELKSFKQNKGDLIEKAIEQIQKYTNEKNPKIVSFNLGLFVSQTVERTFIGSPSTKKDFWFKPIKDSGNLNSLMEYFNSDRIINNIKWGILFKKTKFDKTRILLRPHQYEAILNINKAISNGQGGYVWHTQGSGKTITISALISSLSHFKNNSSITTVIDVDRTELVDNIFETITSFGEKHISTRVQKARSSNDLKNFLENAEYRGVIVTTTQKFSDWGVLSERDNILLISDEAHRTHSTEVASIEDKMTYLEKINSALPNAIKLGFTGTPIFNSDKNTYSQFGNELHKYTMKNAEDDGIITKIEFSFAEIRLKIDENVEMPDVNPDVINSSKVKNESIERNDALTDEISKSFNLNKAQHLQNKFGDTYKAMVVTSSISQGWIVYKMLTEKMGNTNIKFVGTPQRENQKEEIFNFLSDQNSQSKWISQFKEANSEIEIMIVTDKLLTGYDVPNLRIMYIDKEIKEHNLLQTIARVNRKYENKNYGFVISFRNIKDELISALNVYRETTGDQSEIIKYVNASDHLFDEHLNILENYIQIEYREKGISLYVNDLAYKIKMMNQTEKDIVINSINNIYSTSQIVYNIESDIKKYKIRIITLLRSILNKNENGDNIVKISDEDFAKILNAVLVDGDVTYSMTNKSLDEIMKLQGILPNQKLIEKIVDEVIKEIKEKSTSQQQEMELMQKLKMIVDKYNNDLDDMKNFINELNQMKNLFDLLENPSRWTKFMIDVIKINLGQINLKQAEIIDEQISEIVDEWYSTYQSQRNMKSKLYEILSMDYFNSNEIDFTLKNKIIDDFMEASREEWK